MRGIAGVVVLLVIGVVVGMQWPGKVEAQFGEALPGGDEIGRYVMFNGSFKTRVFNLNDPQSLPKSESNEELFLVDTATGESFLFTSTIVLKEGDAETKMKWMPVAQIER